MFTTTPRFKPREGCEPRPTTSMRPSCVISPTMATTFEVPMSRPTIRFRSFFLGIRASILGVASDASGNVPTDRKAVAVTQIYVTHFSSARGHNGARDTDESFQARGHLLTTESHDHAVPERQLPCATRVELDSRQLHTHAEQARICFQIQFGNLNFGARRADELRQFRWNVRGIVEKQLTA